MPVSGVRNSWLTTETKSLFARFSRSSSATARRCCSNASAEVIATRSSSATASMSRTSLALHSRGRSICDSERALELAADAYRRCGDGDATALSGVLRRWFGETAILADVGHHHRPSESRGELRHRYAPRPAAHGDHPGCGPLVGNVQVIFRHARRNDGAGDAERAPQLVD